MTARPLIFVLLTTVRNNLGFNLRESASSADKVRNISYQYIAINTNNSGCGVLTVMHFIFLMLRRAAKSAQLF
jgi:hypothetical protein